MTGMVRRISPTACGWTPRVVCGLAFLILLSNASAQSESDTAASVADQTISVRQVEALVAKIWGDRPLSDDAKLFLQAKALEQLVNQSLVVEYFREQNMLATDQDIQLEQERLNQELDSVGQSLDEYLREQGLNEAELRERMRFRLSWSRYLTAQLTAENLERHFERFHRELDGTRMKVAQILFSTRDVPPERWKGIEEKAKEIRQGLLDEKLTWLDAVGQHSEAPSRENGGELGWIDRWAPMPEPFSQAAFALQPGEISPPVQTQFGFHLIRCQETQPGTLTWQEAEEAVRRHATQYLFDWIVTKQLPRTPPQFTGRYPYWDSAAGRVIPAMPAVR